MALGHPEPTALFQEASCSLTSLAGQPARTPGPPRSPEAQVPPEQVEATWRYPPYKRKSMSPTLGASGFPGPSQEEWQRVAERDLTINKCNQVPVALDLPRNLPSQPQFSHLS